MLDLRGASLLATFCHAPACDGVEILSSTLVEIGPDGVIGAVIRPDDPEFAARLSSAEQRGELWRAPASARVLPGFVDLHVHAPQYPQLGTALDRPLEDWLTQYTFPLEARYQDLRFAERAYGALVADLLANGTTTVLMFATIHYEASRLLADICLERGMRALIGKVAMDDPLICPDYYRDASVGAALDGTEALIAYVRGHPDNADGRVQPVVTPRFVPSCTDALLEGLAELAHRCGCIVQTHCAESDWEEAYVRSRTGFSDAESLDRFGLLTPHTILAHGNFLTSPDMDLVLSREAGVAHCPLSNAYFSTAVFPLRMALEKGLRVGLGTDIAGGPSASMYDTLRMTVVASRMLEGGVDPSLPPDRRGRPSARQDWRTAFHLATAGGAAALGLDVGTFERGRLFDAQLIDLAAPNGTIRSFDDVDDEESLLQKILYSATRANIVEVWVGGRSVAGATRLVRP